MSGGSEQTSAVSLKTVSKENLQGTTRTKPSAATAASPAASSRSGPSAGPRFKAALSRVFRKLPWGANGGPKPLGRIVSEFHVSCEQLDKRPELDDVRRRQWRSTEALMSQTSRWVERQRLVGWEEEQERGDETMSDSGSLFSLDSLSSAYATALAEQLKHEQAAQSDTASEDSRMSEDSLATESSRKHATVGGFSQTLIPNYSLVTDSPQEGCRTCVSVPADKYWSQQESGATRNSSQSKEMELRLREDFGNMQTTSASSGREPAWSSTEAADSPRIHRDSLPFQRRVMLRGVESSSTEVQEQGLEVLRDSEDVLMAGEEKKQLGQEGNIRGASPPGVSLHQVFADDVTTSCQSGQVLQNICVSPKSIRTSSEGDGGSEKTKDASVRDETTSLQPELQSAWTNSRKRIKGQDSFSGNMKIPKRSSSQKDDNSPVDVQAPDPACVLEAPAAADPPSREPGQVSESRNSSQGGPSVGDGEGNVTKQVAEVTEREMDNYRKVQEHTKHKSQEICSAIDLRISEVVKEHMSPSLKKDLSHQLGCELQRDDRRDGMEDGSEVTRQSAEGSQTLSRSFSNWTSNTPLTNTLLKTSCDVKQSCGEFTGVQRCGFLSVTDCSSTEGSDGSVEETRHQETTNAGKTCQSSFTTKHMDSQTCSGAAALENPQLLLQFSPSVTCSDNWTQTCVVNGVSVPPNDTETQKLQSQSQVQTVLAESKDERVRGFMQQKMRQEGRGGKNKSKRIRRSKVPAHTSSSSESSLEFSELEEDDKTPRVHYSRPACKCLKLGTQSEARQADFPASLSEGKCKVNTGSAGPAHPASHKTNEPAGISPKPHDSLMHFSSSDINPFALQWQDRDWNQQPCRNPAFGSAADLTSVAPLLNGTEKQIMRCCSVDGGLNGQISPFSSHLSSYAANKQLSRTLSSTEGPKTSAPRQQEPPDVNSRFASLTINGESGGFGKDSSRVDEMFVCSSEQEPHRSRTRAGRRRTCEHGTQTQLQLVNSSNGSRNKGRHQRSNTDVPATRRTRADIRECPTWASMESMSAHISKLIHSTSDLLGDVQGMRTGETSRSSLRRSANASNLSISCSDSSTQTAVDVGIQTENEVAVGQAAEERPHQVSVIVKVVGSQGVSVSQDNDELLTQANLKINRFDSSASQTGSVPLKTRPAAAAECQQRERSAASRGVKQGMPEAPRHKSAREDHSPSARNDPSHSHKQAAFTDRGSSPIRTVGAKSQVKQDGNRDRIKPPVSDGPAPTPQSVSHEELSEVSCDGSDEQMDGSDKDEDIPALPSLSHMCPIMRPPAAGKPPGCSRPVGFLVDAYDPPPASSTTDHLQQDHMVSPAPSECNTDVLVNMKPVSSASPRPAHQLVPEELPMHNKFTNWSGISRERSDPSNRPTPRLTNDQGRMRNWPYWAEAESYASNVVQSDRKAREIERLRLEREQVMASVGVGVNPTPLTVELTEAKLHYRQGETDTLLKMLSPGSRGETKQLLYDR